MSRCVVYTTTFDLFHGTDYSSRAQIDVDTGAGLPCPLAALRVDTFPGNRLLTPNNMFPLDWPGLAQTAMEWNGVEQSRVS